MCGTPPVFQDRQTHVQLLFTWNPSPLRSSKLSFGYLLLPPKLCTRSFFSQSYAKSLTATPQCPHYSLLHHVTTMIVYRSHSQAPSMFGASSFSSWVVTHSLAEFNFHDHRHAVKMNKQPLWYLMSEHLSTLTQCQVHPSSPDPAYQKMAHVDLSLRPRGSPR